MTTTGKDLVWSCGMTTMEGREFAARRTMASLVVNGGFPANSIATFCDSHPCRSKQLGAFANWVLAAWELYLANPRADRYAIFQDDITCGVNLRKFLDQSPEPARGGYWNLCLWPGNADGRKGWYPAPNPCGLGAQGLVFTNSAMRIILMSRWLTDHPLDRIRGNRAIDGIVRTIMDGAGYTEYVHNPSLVKHEGSQCSTLQLTHYPETVNFHESLDLLTCLDHKND